MFGDVFPVLDQVVADGLLGIGGTRAKMGHAVDDVGDQMKAVDVVHHHHVEGS